MFVTKLTQNRKMGIYVTCNLSKYQTQRRHRRRDETTCSPKRKRPALFTFCTFTAKKTKALMLACRVPWQELRDEGSSRDFV